MAYHLGDGRKIVFWKDVWRGQIPLGVCFPTIFRICEDPDVLVADVIRPEGLALRFRRSFGPNEVGVASTPSHACGGVFGRAQ